MRAPNQHASVSIGARFGRWVVLRRSDPSLVTRRGYFLCRCNCRGKTERHVYGHSLLRGLSTSCGCIKHEAAYIGGTSKICRACGRALPFSAFGPRPDRGTTALRSKCRSCANTRRAAARLSASPRERKRSLALARKWKRDNRERNRGTKRAWEARNAERVSVYSRRTSAKWRKANVELARRRVLASKAKRAEYYREQTRVWAKLHPARCRAKYKAYMTAKFGAVPSWMDEYDRFVIQEIYDKAQVLVSITRQAWHVDHIVPLRSPRVCGLHTHGNLRVTPGTLNLSKGNREWPDMP